ncbi:MAG: hypothetical protein ABSE73_23600, partial [Planctomycetota bacterium]
MASVFQQKGRDGKALEAWRFKYRGADGKWHYGVGWPDKTKTRRHALNVEAEARAIRTGEKESPAAWLANRNKAIGEVVSEYLTWGKAAGGWRGFGWAPVHAENRRRCLDWWVERLSLRSMSEIELGAVE